MSDQLCDRENLVKKLFNTSDMAQIRRILIEESIAKMVEPPMTDGQRIAAELLTLANHPRGRMFCINWGLPTESTKGECVDMDERLSCCRAAIAEAIDAALDARTEEAAKIVEKQFYRVGGREQAYAETAAAAIRKLGEAK